MYLNVYIVYGPPMSGKTSYVIEHMEKGDIVVDMDSLYKDYYLHSLTYLNTSNVNVNHNFLYFDKMDLSNLNTSNVNVNPVQLILTYTGYRHLNTSNVNVNPLSLEQ